MSTTTTPPSPPLPTADPSNPTSQTPPLGQPNAEQTPETTPEQTPKSDFGRPDSPFWKRLRGERETKKKEDAATVTQGPSTEGLEGEASPSEKPQPQPIEPVKEKKPASRSKPKGPAQPAQQPAVDPIRIAEAAGREIGQRITDEIRTSRTDSPPSDHVVLQAPPLPDEYEADRAVYERMAKMQPERYGKLIEGLSDAAKKEDARRQKWEQDNPGETYDPDAKEHDAFYEKLYPTIKQSDFKSAERAIERDLIKEEVRRELRAEIEPEITTLTHQRRLQEVAPDIEAESGALVTDVLAAINEDYKALASDMAQLSTLKDKDSDAATITAAVFKQYSPQSTANLLLHKGVVVFDPKNPVHMELFDLAKRKENDILQLPHADRFDQSGRLFAPREEYNRMSAAQKRQHWTVSGEHIAHWLRQEASETASKLYKETVAAHESYASRKGLSGKAGPQGSQQPPPVKSETKPEKTAAGSHSPSIPAAIVSGTDTKPGAGQSKSGLGIFFKRIGSS